MSLKSHRWLTSVISNLFIVRNLRVLKSGCQLIFGYVDVAGNIMCKRSLEVCQERIHKDTYINTDYVKDFSRFCW